MLGPIIGRLVGLVVISFIAALILQLASKIVCQQAVDYGDAFKTSFIALGISRLSSLGLEAAGFDQWFIAPLLALAIWTILISSVIGLAMSRSLLIALLMLAMTMAMVWTVGLVLGAM